MAAATLDRRPVNGSVSTQSELGESAEYEKILHLSDQIFAGTHPRLKIPVHLVGGPGLGNVSSQTLPSPRTTTAFAEPRPLTSTGSLRDAEYPPDAVRKDDFGPRGAPGMKASSTMIDPILLRNSDELVKAEIQLRRQRIERALKNNGEYRSAALKRKQSTVEVPAELDVSAILAKALEVVKPDGANDPPLGATVGDSFDENSFYSSQQNESSFADGDDTVASRAEGPDMAQAKQNDGDDTVASRAEVPDMAQAKQNGGRKLPGELPSPQLGPGQGARHAEKRQLDSRTMQDGPEDATWREQIYEAARPSDTMQKVESSPGMGRGPQKRLAQAGAYGGHIHDDGEAGSGRVFHHLRLRSQSPEQRQPESQRQAEPGPRMQSPEVTIFASHIRSPIAPQPARVSPLVSRIPPLAQTGRFRNPATGHYQQRRESADSPRLHLNPRKRRRSVGSGDLLPRSPVTQASDSPEPYIKEEPVSPPSNLTLEERPTKRQERIYASLDDYDEAVPRRAVAGSPMALGASPVQRRQRYERYDRYGQVEPVHPSAFRVPARELVPQPVVVDQEPHGYANAYYPAELHPQTRYTRQYSPRDVRPSRVSSRTAIEGPRFYRGDVEPIADRYIVPNRSRSSPTTYALRERSPASPHGSFVMGPPPAAPSRYASAERGIRYYGAPISRIVRHEVNPISGPGGAEAYYDRYRIPMVEHRPHEGRYVEAAPPLRAASRSIYEQGQVIDDRAYRRGEDSVRPAEGSRNEIFDGRAAAGVRRVSIMDDEAPHRARIERTGSMRAEPGRYEVPSEFLSRSASVRPEALSQGHTGSVGREMGPPVRRGFSLHAGSTRREYFPREIEPAAHIAQQRGGHFAAEAIYSERRRVMEGEGYRDDMAGVSYR